jgi:D-threonine aldolase
VYACSTTRPRVQSASGAPLSCRFLQTPTLVIDLDVLEANIRTMAAVLPGPRLRPHVKAHKCTSLARLQRDLGGHTGFCCATVREVEGMAAAGLGDDLLLANEVLDCSRLGSLDARVTVAVDSVETIDAAVRGGVREVLVDVDVGLPRCGCAPGDAGRLADHARSRGLAVRGVMGYEGHATAVTDRAERAAVVERSMTKLLAAQADVGGEVVSAGATVTYDLNRWATEIQAGSYALMDSYFRTMTPEFGQAVFVDGQVISVSSKGWAVANVGLKSLGMDHGPPTLAGDTGEVFIVSDEHISFRPSSPVAVGDPVRVVPAHVDPTVAYHDHAVIVRGDTPVDEWPIDLRGW